MSETVPVLGVDRRIFVNGVHVATVLSILGTKSDNGPYFEPKPAYGHAEKWERDEVLRAAYAECFARRIGRYPSRSFTLDEWRDGVPYMEVAP